MLFCSISRKQSSSGLSVVTATSSRVMISEVFIQAGHLFSAATLSDTSLCEITPVSFPLAFITPTERTCFSRRYCAAWCTLVSSVMEKTSFRDPMRSDTFTGPSAGNSGRIVGPTQRRLQDEFERTLRRLSGWLGYAPAQETRSGSRGFPADNIVSFNHRGHAHPRAAVFHSALDTHYFAQGSDKHLRTMGDLRGQGQGDVQL